MLYLKLSFLNQLVITFESNNNRLFLISIHEKNQFMPGTSKLFGSTYTLVTSPFEGCISLNAYTLELTETTYLNRHGSPCDSTGSYNPFSQCIKEHVEDRMKCKYVVNQYEYKILSLSSQSRMGFTIMIMLLHHQVLISLFNQYF